MHICLVPVGPHAKRQVVRVGSVAAGCLQTLLRPEDLQRPGLLVCLHSYRSSTCHVYTA